jgi:hypothetical protein
MLVLPNKSAVVWDKFLKENKILVYKYIVREIKKHVNGTSDTIELFKFEDNSMFAWIPKTKILVTLNEALKVFIAAEEYEYASKTTAIITEYHINKLISESIEIKE